MFHPYFPGESAEQPLRHAAFEPVARIAQHRLKGTILFIPTAHKREPALNGSIHGAKGERSAAGFGQLCIRLLQDLSHARFIRFCGAKRLAAIRFFCNQGEQQRRTRFALHGAKFFKCRFERLVEHRAAGSKRLFARLQLRSCFSMLDGLRMRCFCARFGFSSERCGFLLCTCTCAQACASIFAASPRASSKMRASSLSALLIPFAIRCLLHYANSTRNTEMMSESRAYVSTMRVNIIALPKPSGRLASMWMPLTATFAWCSAERRPPNATGRLAVK